MKHFTGSQPDYRNMPAPTSGATDALPYPCQTPLHEIRLENTRIARKAYLAEKMRRDEATGVAPFSFNTYPDLHVKVSDAFQAEKDRIENVVLPEVWNCVMDLQRNNMGYLNQCMANPQHKSRWRRHYYNDKKGDMLLFTRPRIGNYHFARASFTLKNVSPLTVLTNMHSQSLPKRQQYSKHIAEYHVLERNPAIYEKYFVEHDRMHEIRKASTRADADVDDPSPGGLKWNRSATTAAVDSDEDAGSSCRPAGQLFNDNEHLIEMALGGERNWYVEYNRFYAPAPAAHRDITMLVEKKYDPKEDCYYIYGCSIDFINLAEHEEVEKVRYLKQNGRSMYCVDGIIMFCWQLLPVGVDTVCTYTNVMNPSGWAPPAIVSWFKGEVAKELAAARTALYAEKAVVSPFTKRLAAMLRTCDVENNSNGIIACNNHSQSYDPAVVASHVYAQREAEHQRATQRRANSGNSDPKFVPTDAVTTPMEVEAFRQRLRDGVLREREDVLRESVPSWLSRYFLSSKSSEGYDEENRTSTNIDVATIAQQLMDAANTYTDAEREQLMKCRRHASAGAATSSKAPDVPVLTMTEEDPRAVAAHEEEVMTCGDPDVVETPNSATSPATDTAQASKTVGSYGSSGATSSVQSEDLAYAVEEAAAKPGTDAPAENASLSLTMW